MTWYKPWTWGDNDAAAAQNANSRGLLGENAGHAGAFANQTAGNYNALTGQLGQSADQLRALASGQNSVSALQLQQALGQNQSAQRSMALGASPVNQAMAARTAAIQSGRLGAGLAGQQAVAGLQERQGAQNALAQLLLQQRGQDLQGTLGGYGVSNQGFGMQIDPNQDKSWAEKNAPLISGLAGGIAASDERLKDDIDEKAGKKKARALLEGLKAYTFKYKPGVAEAAGKGEQVGIMAQELERVAPSAVINTRGGKMVHGAKLATALAATLPGLNDRLKKLEGTRK